MSEYTKIKLGLNNLTVSEKLQFIATLIDRINGNAYFPDPATLLDEVIVARDGVQVSLTAREAAQAAAKAGTEELSQREEVVDKALNELARKVELIAHGDAVILESAGFNTYVPGKQGPVGPMPEVTNLSLKTGTHQDELQANWNSIPEASNYVVEYTVAPIYDPHWVQAGMPTASKFLIKGLESGTKYWVRVAANASSGKGPWSDPATMFAP